MSVSTTLEQSQRTASANWPQWVTVVGLIYLLLVAVGMISSGFNTATGGHAKELFAFAGNPLTGLVIGIVATALIQSSSTVTSIIVGLVAGGLPVQIAIPMVMGANIGTTITNTIVSLGHVRQGEEFKRAFAAATVHDFFNLISVAIFLPLEMMFGILQKAGGALGNVMIHGDSMSIKGFNFLKPMIKPPIKALQSGLGNLGLSDVIVGSLLIMLGIGMIFFVITFIGKLLKVLMVGRAKDILHRAVGRGPISGIATGTAVTVFVQSSSTTTSLIVPLAGAGVFSLRQVYPFTLGANIGTCITALLAATAVTGANAIFALQVALVHLIYNILGVIVIYGIPILRNIPLYAAETLADMATRNKLYVALYIACVFLLIPLVLIGISQALGW